MTRDEWVAAFVEELLKLRPHLKTYGGGSRVALGLALTSYSPDVDPVAAARRYDTANPRSKS